METKFEGLFDRANALLESFHSFLYLTVRKLEERACFSELLIDVGPFFSVTLTHMQLQPFGDQLKLMPEFFVQDTAVPPSIGNVGPQLLPQSVRDNLAVVPSIGDIGTQRLGDKLKLLPESFGEDTGVASRFGDVYS